LAVFDGVSSNSESYLYINEFKKQIKNRYKEFLNERSQKLEQLFYNAAIETKLQNINGQSTLTALFIPKGGKASKWISIGDSRLYVFSNSYIETITSDDSINNILTNYLGKDHITINDFKAYELDINANYLICSDGFYSIMHNHLKEFFSALNFKNMANVKKKLASLQQNKNIDDSTYIIIKA